MKEKSLIEVDLLLPCSNLIFPLAGTAEGVPVGEKQGIYFIAKQCVF